ncbi:MAG TPA: ATP-binding cassette domain-containing protein, partial [Candidatus Saccharimonadales bacterium]|nr:ATP-binding cassette domain-containing protein [Candidatus Saccharimonadales bacterium]
AAHLTKKYRKKVAVSDLSFVVETGKVTGFLGPNGAGKSTTMRLMLGLDNGGGSTTFDGKPLHKYVRPSQVVGILLEAKAFHPTRSPRQHLRILADAGGIPTGRVEEALELVGLSDVAKKKPGKFSLGMSQRLGIAAAILGKPKYLMLDEPANGLDPEGIAWLRDFLKDYADKGNAVFVSSHLLSEMSQMADNVVVIGKGKLIASGSIKQIISGSTHSGVFVRADGLSKLEKAFAEKQWSFEKADGGLKVSGVKTDEIGKLAFKTGVPILELANHAASLEEAFLELTAGSEEYQAKSEGKK